MEIATTVVNGASVPISLELLTSFSLGGITPFADDVAAERLVVHRIRSSWASEGRLDSQPAEQLQLEPNFGRYGASCERFGQVGTMPTRGFFPFVAVEDIGANAIWGAQLAWAGSWQMEVYRRDDTLAISGGLADRELGHWTKTLAPGASLTSPTAYLTCVEGNLEALCDRLTRAQQAAVDKQPSGEQALPILFNEWCNTWGNPTHDNVLATADRLKGSAVKYLVIDAGWYKGHGDWRINTDRFPDLKSTVAAVRERGMLTGLWFEYENCAPSSEAFVRNEWHLHRDGMPINVNNRRFFDLTIPAVQEYLSERMINLLRDNDIGYLKIDYNETIGIGCDGAESLGEKMRQHVQAVCEFVARIRRKLPELVIENCASGGHRLEPSMLALTAMSSFSDAHESQDIPIIAANLHRVMLPRQSQIWAVLRKGDDERRLVYSLAATFLGRMCLSGDIRELNTAQWAVYQAAEALYGKAWPVIKNGRSYRGGSPQLSYRKPLGWQSMIRMNDDMVLIVIHSFGATNAVAIDLPCEVGELIGSFARGATQLKCTARRIDTVLEAWDGAVLLFHRT